MVYPVDYNTLAFVFFISALNSKGKKVTALMCVALLDKMVTEFSGRKK